MYFIIIVCATTTEKKKTYFLKIFYEYCFFHFQNLHYDVIEQNDQQCCEDIKWFMDLVYQMLVVMPDTRITAVEALAHPFLTIMHFIKYPSTAMTKNNLKLMESCKLDIWIDLSPCNLYSSGPILHTSDLKISQHCPHRSAPSEKALLFFYKNILYIIYIVLYLLYLQDDDIVLKIIEDIECDNNKDNCVQSIHAVLNIAYYYT